MPGEGFRHALAIDGIGARHRNQILHRHVRRDFAVADALLDRFRNRFHQRQPARHPTEAAIEAPGQILKAVAETLFQLRQQPPLFDRRFAFAHTHRALQHQRVGVVQIPNDGLDRVAPQLLESRDAFVPIDDLVTAG
jgi:hypothetical protein